MHETYNELFKLQNLLEKTARSVAASNSLKSLDGTELAPTSPDRRLSEGTAGGRPYYPGSSLKGGSRLLLSLGFDFVI